jgi:hypothetical protein
MSEELWAQAAYEAAAKWDTGLDEPPLLLKPWADLSERDRDCWRQVAVAVVDRWREAGDGDERLPDDAPLRYALVEQMGFRRTYGTVRETEFVGKRMLEVTSMVLGSVQLVAPESLYQVTWLTREQAESATRTGSHSPAALPAANPNPWGDYGADDYPDEGKDDGMSAAERGEHADLHGFALDAADEAHDLEREAGADL